jgi:hypothetical protein
MSINPNDVVMVKLTTQGKKYIVDSIDRENDDIRKNRSGCLMRFNVPEWDGDGWITGQMHTILGYFGDCWHLSLDMPFTELKKHKDKTLLQSVGAEKRNPK